MTVNYKTTLGVTYPKKFIFSSTFVGKHTLSALSKGAEAAARVSPALLANLPWVAVTVGGAALTGGIAYLSFRAFKAQEKEATVQLPCELLELLCEKAVEKYERPEDLELIYRLRRVNHGAKAHVDRLLRESKTRSGHSLPAIHCEEAFRRGPFAKKRREIVLKAIKSHIPLVPGLAFGTAVYLGFFPGIFGAIMAVIGTGIADSCVKKLQKAGICSPEQAPVLFHLLLIPSLPVALLSVALLAPLWAECMALACLFTPLSLLLSLPLVAIRTVRDTEQKAEIWRLVHQPQPTYQVAR